MRNPRLIENRSYAAKAEFLVEADYGHLGVQVDFPRAELRRRRDGALQQLRTHALVPIISERPCGRFAMPRRITMRASYRFV
jgi:hypothetical protein